MRFAVCLTGMNSRARIIPNVSASKAVLETESKTNLWKDRLSSTHLSIAPIDWFIYNKIDVAGGVPVARTTIPDREEIELVMVQFCWTVLRICRNEAVREILSRVDWMELFLKTVLDETISKPLQLICFRILRFLLPVVSPDHPVFQRLIMLQVYDKQSTMEYPSLSLSRKIFLSESNPAIILKLFKIVGSSCMNRLNTTGLVL